MDMETPFIVLNVIVGTFDTKNMETPTTSFDYFVETFCTKDRNGKLVTTWSFKDHWLKPQGLDLRMSPENAYKNVWFPRVNKINQDLAFLDVFARKLERLAASGEIECVKSNQSESRYYYKDGFRYRVSGHRYPTGSMTEFVYDDNGNVIGGTIDLIESSAADLVRKYWKE